MTEKQTKNNSLNRQYQKGAEQPMMGDVGHSASSRAASKVTSAGSSLPFNTSASTIRNRVALSAALQLLTPEEVMEQQEYDMDLEDLGSSDEYTSDDADYYDEAGVANGFNTGRTSALFGCVIPEPPKQPRKQEDLMADTRSEYAESELSLSRQLMLLEADADDDISINSEEERDILKEIKDEVTNKVKEEMKDELAVYKVKRQQQQKGTPVPETNDDDMDPKLKQAYLKMKLLDKILVKKTKREKEVKRDRILLQRKLREELEAIKSSTGDNITFEEKRNTEKFMMLALPPSHSAGVFLDEGSDPIPSVTPVFQTQVPDDGRHSKKSSHDDNNKDRNSPNFSARQESSTGRESDDINSMTSDGTSGARSHTSKGGHRRHKRRDKNFIKRNVELAADAANTIAMTDDEKNRLEELLADLEALPEIQEEEDCSVGGYSNPYQVALSAGEGFLPTTIERRRLNDIDLRLKSLLPPDDYESIASTPHSAYMGQVSSVLFTRTHVESMSDLEKLGEEALKVTKGERDMQSRLKDIEDELGKLSTTVEQEIQSPSLSGSQLDELLSECSRTMSRATAETEQLSQSSCSMSTYRSSLYENPPHLPDGVLQELLREARSNLPPDALVDPTQHTRYDGLDRVTEETGSEWDTSRLSAGSRPVSQTSNASQIFQQKSNNLSTAQRLQSPVPRLGDLHRQSSIPTLPEIDPKGRLSTRRYSSAEKLNNEQQSHSRCGSSNSTRSNAITVRNSLTDTNKSTNLIMESVDSYNDLWGESETTDSTPRSRPSSSSAVGARTTSSFSSRSVNK